MVFRRSICYDSFTNWDEKIKGGDTLTKEDMKQISDLMDEKFVAFEGRMDEKFIASEDRMRAEIVASEGRMKGRDLQHRRHGRRKDRIV